MCKGLLLLQTYLKQYDFLKYLKQYDFLKYLKQYHHHDSVLLARISLTLSLSLYLSLSPLVSIVHRSRKTLQVTSCICTELLSIGSSWSSNLCSSMWKGPPEYIAYEFVFTSPAYLVRLIWMVFVIGGRRSYVAVLWDVASRTCSMHLVTFLCNYRRAFFSIRLVSVQVIHRYISIYTTAAWKKTRFVLLDRSDFHMTDSLKPWNFWQIISNIWTI